MSITKISSPENWARVNDTNRMVYKFSSDNYTEPNFQFQFDLGVFDVNGNYTPLGTYNLHPTSTGTVEFNPSSIYRNYLGWDLSLSATTLTEFLNTAKKFQMTCSEFYGTPPVKVISGNWFETDGLNVYNGCQQNIPYDYTPLNTYGNMKWVMQDTPSTGQFLTDAMEYHLGSKDLCYIYALGPKGSTEFSEGRPDKVRFKVYYIPTGTTTDYYLNENNPNKQSYEQSVANASTRNYANEYSALNTGTTLKTLTFYITSPTFSYNASLGYYIPVGPYNTMYQNSIIYNFLDFNINNWVFYEVDLIYNFTPLSTYPLRIIKKEHCDKYEAWQLFWLNPHGGFDTYVFNKKVEIDYKVERSTYKIKIPPDYSTYAAGERVFNTNITEEITLTSDLLTQSESQLLIQLVQSPIVYAVKSYEYSGTTTYYSVPYIITSDTIKYEQKKNSKEIYMEIKMRAANEKIIQKN